MTTEKDDEKKIKKILNEGKALELVQQQELLAADESIKLTGLEEEMLRAEASDDEDAQLLIQMELDRKKRDLATKQAMSMVNQDTPSKYLLERPTWGPTQAPAEIHTTNAYLLILGRSGNSPTTGKFAPITGLYRAASKRSCC